MFHSPFADGVVVLVVLLLFFGPKRLPMLSRSIGESIREFQGGVSHDSSEPTGIDSTASTPPQTATVDPSKQTA